MAVYGGLQPWGAVKHATLYPIAASYGTSLFKGDPISASVGGYVVINDGSAQMIGAALAFFDYQMQPINYWVASTATIGYVLVADDPDQEYVIAEDASSSQLAQTDMFANLTFTSGTGDSATGLSAYTLDSSEVATTATDPVKLMKLAPIIGNQVYSATLCPNPKWIVRCNYHISSTTGLTT